MIPIRTMKALRNAGLNDEQARAAWDIIIDHLGIASPPKKPTKNGKSRTKARNKEPIPLTEANWHEYDQMRGRLDSEIRETFETFGSGTVIDISGSAKLEDKPKHTIAVSEMITDEVKRLKTETKTDDSSPKKEKRIGKRDGTW